MVDILPFTKKLAQAAGGENWNLLQVRLLQPFVPECHADFPWTEQRPLGTPGSGPRTLPYDSETRRGQVCRAGYRMAFPGRTLVVEVVL